MTIASQVLRAERIAPQAAWRVLVSRLLWTAGTGVCAVAALNLVVNPDGIYPFHLLPQLTWGARPQKAAMLKDLEPQPEVLIVGSSRVMALPPSDVERATGLRAFNAGVDSAKAEDFYVMLRYAVESAHVSPKLLLIGCDVDAFDEAPLHYYLQQPSVLSTFLKEGVPWDWRWHQVTRLLSYQQAKLSLMALYKMAFRSTRRISHTESDGRLIFDEWERQRAAGKFSQEHEIAAAMQRIIPRYDAFTGLSQQRLDYLHAVLDYARDHQIRVILFMPPIHPEVERDLRPHGYDLRKREVASALRELCSVRGVAFYDFSSAQSIGAENSQFYDGVHYDGKMATLLIEHLLPMSAHALQ